MSSSEQYRSHEQSFAGSTTSTLAPDVSWDALPPPSPVFSTPLHCSSDPVLSAKLEPCEKKQDSSNNGSPQGSVDTLSPGEGKVETQTTSLPLRPEPPTKTPWPHRPFTLIVRASKAVGRAFRRQVSFRSILDLIDIREYFWPMTWAKYGMLLFACCIVAAIVVSDYFTGWIEKSIAITHTSMLPILILVIGVEPLMSLVFLFLAQVPDMPAERLKPTDTFRDLETGSTEKEDLSSNSTALVIPCHNSDQDVIKRVIQSAYPHFRPKDIFIIDNGRSPHPPSLQFRDYIRSLHPEIRYIWSPIGSKNVSQLVGALAAKEYDYIMTVDDDVSIPAAYRHPVEMITEDVKAVAFPLKAIDEDGKVSLFLVGWQDCEYRMAGMNKMAENRVAGVSTPHGAGWFVERTTFITLMTFHHPIDFIAEDCNSGFGMMKMGKKIGFDGRVILETEVPTTFIGPGLNWVKQRYKSWEMGRHGLMWKYTLRLFSFNGQKTIGGILFQKWFFTYAILSNILDWLRIPIIVTTCTQPNFLLQAGLLTLVTIIPLTIYKYIKCRRRRDLQPRFWAIITYPIYKILYSIVSVFGAIRCVLFYVGGHRMPPTVPEMMKLKDPRCFWLDDRFEKNPGFLADHIDNT